MIIIADRFKVECCAGRVSPIGIEVIQREVLRALQVDDQRLLRVDFILVHMVLHLAYTRGREADRFPVFGDLLMLPIAQPGEHQQ